MTARAPFSISEATSWAQDFLRREWRLTLPVALALMALPAIALDVFAPPAPAATPGGAGGGYAALAAAVRARILFGVPAALFALFGALAISVLALAPGISVGEALRLALRRMPRLLGATLLAAAAGAVASIAVGMLLFAVGGAAGQAAPAQASLTATIMVMVMLVVTARFCLVTPVLAASELGPVAAVRRSWALSRNQFWRLLALLSIVLVASVILSVAVQSLAGVIGFVVARASGVPGLGMGLVSITSAIVGAVVSMLFSVLLAGVYRQLAED